MKSPAILRAFVFSIPVVLLGAGGQAAGPVLFEAEHGGLTRGADRLNDPAASGGSCVRLPKKGGSIAMEIRRRERGGCHAAQDFRL